jgi:hypothetical protein
MPRVYIVFSACLAVLILGPVGCGSDDSNEESAAATATTTSVEEANTTADTGLVGEWSTENVCQEQLRAIQEAGLDKLVSEAVAGAEYPGQKPSESDPCRGAKPMQHSHSFGEFFDGSFASYDQNGQQVDDGRYTTVDDHTFTLADPPVPVHYRIAGDKATFKVVIPDCKTRQCEESTAYVTSVFFPRVYERVK